MSVDANLEHAPSTTTTIHTRPILVNTRDRVSRRGSNNDDSDKEVEMVDGALLADEASSDEADASLIAANDLPDLMDKAQVAISKIPTLARILLPDSLKDSPYTTPTFVLIAGLLITLPIRLYFLLVVIGFCLGILIIYPDENDAATGIISRHATLLTASMGNPSLASTPVAAAPAMQGDGPNKPAASSTNISITPAIDAALGQFFDRLVPALTDGWFAPMCRSGQDEFPTCIRTCINAAVMNFARYLSLRGSDVVILSIYGITNALIVHMKEFRDFEASEMPLKEYLASSRAKIRHFRSSREELEHLLQVSALLLRRLLPRQETRSICLNSLLKELMASSVFWPVIEKLSDPDFINQVIIKVLQDPADSLPIVEKGWNVVIIKIIKGRNIVAEPNNGGLYCMIHIAGRRIKTHKIKDSSQPLWNETFQFKISEAVKGHLKAHVQLLQHNYLSQDSSLGFVKLVPNFDAPGVPQQSWLRFVQNSKSAGGIVERPPEIFVEAITVLSSNHNGHARKETMTSHSRAQSPRPPRSTSPLKKQPVMQGPEFATQSAPLALWNAATNTKASPVFSMPTNTPDLSSSVSVPSEISTADRLITLDATLQNNELFIEFHQFLDDFKAPPYLQFLMNVDALRQFAAMELGINPKDPAALDAYFRGPLSPEKLDQFRMIKHDASDVFMTHFHGNSRYKIPLGPKVQAELQERLRTSCPGEDGLIHGAVGPNIFIPAYRWILGELEEVYFNKFKESDAFRRFLDRANYATLNFTVDDDKLSTYSAESAPSNAPLSFNARQGSSMFAENTDRRRRSQTVVVDADFASEGIIDAGPDLRRSASVTSLDCTSNLGDNDNAPWQGPFGEKSSDDAELDVRKITTAINVLREQLTVVTEALEHGKAVDDEAAYLSLIKKKKDILAQIDALCMILDSKKTEHSHAKDDFWLDLRNVIAKVSMCKTAQDAGDDGVISTLWNSTIGTMSNTDPLFDIEIVKASDTDSETATSNSPSPPTIISLSVVSRAFTDFETLHRRLQRQFPKVAKIPFPSKPVASHGVSLDKRLENYIQMLLSDEFIRQSMLLREFVTLDGDLERSSSTVSFLSDSAVGKTVKGAFKTATSMLASVSGTAYGGSHGRRKKFYETRERHTTNELRSSDSNSSLNEAPALPRFFSSDSITQGASVPQTSSLAPSIIVGDRHGGTAANGHDEGADGTSVPPPTPLLHPLPVAGNNASSSLAMNYHRQAACPDKAADQHATMDGSAESGDKEKNSDNHQFKLVDSFSDAEVDMLLETCFAFIMETFDLRDPNQWLRRKILGVFKQLLKQAYGDAINKVLTEQLNAGVSEQKLLNYLSLLTEALWPENVWLREHPPPPERTEDQKLATMIEARTLFMKHTPDIVQNMVGRYNGMCGMTRIFNMLQHPELNKQFFHTIIDIIVKLLFAEQK